MIKKLVEVCGRSVSAVGLAALGAGVGAGSGLREVVDTRSAPGTINSDAKTELLRGAAQSAGRRPRLKKLLDGLADHYDATLPLERRDAWARVPGLAKTGIWGLGAVALSQATGIEASQLLQHANAFLQATQDVHHLGPVPFTWEGTDPASSVLGALATGALLRAGKNVAVGATVMGGAGVGYALLAD